MSTATEAKSRPILFSGPMVKAILEGRKTQTRRTAKVITDCFSPAFPCNALDEIRMEDGAAVFEVQRTVDDTSEHRFPCPYGQPGDRLWVRETWSPDLAAFFPHYPVVYKADGFPAGHDIEAGRWRPSIHMPRWASRITLEITGVRVERLQDISREDAFAEGVERVDPYETSPELPPGMPACFKNYSRDGGWFAGDPVASYRTLWDSINGDGSWKSNPWTWVLEFRRVKP